MVEIPTLPGQVAIELEAICSELENTLARYRRIRRSDDGHIHYVPDVLAMHDQVWRAVALLREALPLPAEQATQLAHLYQTRRHEFTSALSLSGLQEIVDLLRALLPARTTCPPFH